jgi:CheY-like chemotaxis protein
MTVLLVEDDASVRSALERRLHAAGIHVVSVASVRGAIERLRDDAVDVVLTDLRLPDGDGDGLLLWLGSNSPSTRVVVLSAFVTPEFRRRFPESETLRVLEKPADLDELIRVLVGFGPRRGVYGNSIEVELFDYVQMIAVSGRDKLIEVRTPDGSGHVWFEHGDVVHAEFSGLRGETAFYRLLASGRGSFREQVFAPPAQHSVTRSSTALLMEAARLADEGLLTSAGTVPEVIEDQVSFADLAKAAAARADVGLTPAEDDDFILPSDDDDETSILLDDAGPASAEDQPAAGSDAFHVVPGRDASASMSGSVLASADSREALLQEFREIEGVSGAAIVSSSGKVLAEEMGSQGALVTLAGFHMRGAARIARSLGYHVFDGIVARCRNGQQMVVASLGGTAVVMAVEIGCDAEAVRDRVLEVG